MSIVYSFDTNMFAVVPSVSLSDKKTETYCDS